MDCISLQSDCYSAFIINALAPDWMINALDFLSTPKRARSASPETVLLAMTLLLIQVDIQNNFSNKLTVAILLRNQCLIEKLRIIEKLCF